MAEDDAVASEAFEQASSIMVVLDTDGTVRRINDRGCQVLGYDRSTLLGTDWFETVVPEDSAFGLTDVLARVRADDECDIHENAVRTEDGHVRVVKWHVTGHRNDDGRLTHLLVSGTDITDLVETKRRLRRYEQTVESSTNLLAAVDREYRYVLANRGYRAFHGLGETIADDLTVEDVLGTEQFQAVKPNIDRALAGESTTYDTELTGADGRDRTFNVRYFPLEDDDGTIQGAVAALRDVTERRERERRRREVRDTFEELFHAINDAVFVHDLDGRFLAVNDTARDRLGYDDGELLGMTPWDIDTADHAGSIDGRIETIRDQGELTFETTHVTKSGERRPVEITASLVTYFGTEAILSVARDISERQERERQLRREVDRLDEFASVISHDLRNPLNVAQGRLTLAAEACESDHLDAVDGALDRMAAIIDDTLTLARQGKTVGETEPVAVADLLRQCWQSVATAAVTYELVDEFVLRADRDRLRQVFENLVRNTVEHAGSDTTVRIGRIGTDGFYVEDDGRGLPETDAERVFEAGFTTQDRGTGFGLTIVRQIAEAHGWAVTATTSETGGARFEFTDVEFAD
ncbi:MAG: PAS domain-containing sensor histidine kinase [Halorhabdus sp.]